eukprot:TRINITY_DN24843_c0_g1_i2.p1 TRINITY_DN24843_c0_g1~~TRINITY_DN24843_c0_g1_i2.p1  ORF type:complete len:857 (+),score=164.28 TRINITY_DN24843_c0_g1_i2:89-2572(+)
MAGGQVEAVPWERSLSAQKARIRAGRLAGSLAESPSVKGGRAASGGPSRRRRSPQAARAAAARRSAQWPKQSEEEEEGEARSPDSRLVAHLEASPLSKRRSGTGNATPASSVGPGGPPPPPTPSSVTENFDSRPGPSAPQPRQSRGAMPGQWRRAAPSQQAAGAAGAAAGLEQAEEAAPEPESPPLPLQRPVLQQQEDEGWRPGWRPGSIPRVRAGAGREASTSPVARPLSPAASSTKREASGSPTGRRRAPSPPASFGLSAAGSGRKGGGRGRGEKGGGSAGSRNRVQPAKRTEVALATLCADAKEEQLQALSIADLADALDAGAELSGLAKSVPVVEALPATLCAGPRIPPRPEPAPKKEGPHILVGNKPPEEILEAAALLRREAQDLGNALRAWAGSDGAEAASASLEAEEPRQAPDAEAVPLETEEMPRQVPVAMEDALLPVPVAGKEQQASASRQQSHLREELIEEAVQDDFKGLTPGHSTAWQNLQAGADAGAGEDSARDDREADRLKLPGQEEILTAREDEELKRRQEKQRLESERERLDSDLRRLEGEWMRLLAERKSAAEAELSAAERLPSQAQQTPQRPAHTTSPLSSPPSAPRPLVMHQQPRIRATLASTRSCTSLTPVVEVPSRATLPPNAHRVTTLAAGRVASRTPSPQRMAMVAPRSLSPQCSARLVQQQPATSSCVRAGAGAAVQPCSVNYYWSAGKTPAAIAPVSRVSCASPMLVPRRSLSPVPAATAGATQQARRSLSPSRVVSAQQPAVSRSVSRERVALHQAPVGSQFLVPRGHFGKIASEVGHADAALPSGVPRPAPLQPSVSAFRQ